MDANRDLVLVGNCQAAAVAGCLYVMRPNLAVASINYGDVQRGSASLDLLFEGAPAVFSQPSLVPAIQREFMARGQRPPIIGTFPNIHFSGYHPDVVYAQADGKSIVGVGITDRLNSALALLAWSSGLDVGATLELFTPKVFDRLGYGDHWAFSRDALLSDARATDVPLDAVFGRWERGQPFMYVPKHPSLPVLADLARGILHALGLTARTQFPERLLPEPFADNFVWPIYPGVADRLGLEGDFSFKLKRGRTPLGRPPVVLTLEEFLIGWFEVYAKLDPTTVRCDRFGNPKFRDFATSLRKQPRLRSTGAAAPVPNPYRGLPSHQFWRSAVAEPATEEVDPVVRAKFTVTAETKVATAGSCFAQHIARALEANGFCHHVVERAPEEACEELAAQFGVFSARYGNIYTARQLSQLFARASGKLATPDAVWHLADGRVLDPFRPNVEPGGFLDRASMERDREAHLNAVDRMLKTLDLFVFTLGLTETWQSEDGLVVPLPPGAVGARSSGEYSFKNMTLVEVVADLNAALGFLFAVNPQARVLLTVSPVPLIATYEPQHALLATTHSKAVLRVAAAETEARFMDRVAYFPSYEIVTGPHARGSYFEDDLRSVAPAAVQHVMRLFLRHYGGAGLEDIAALVSEPPKGAAFAPSLSFVEERQAAAAVFCDEEMLAT